MSQPYKICPNCSTPAALTETQCTRCGRQYRTQFQPTQMVPAQSPVRPIDPNTIQVPPGSHNSTTPLLLALFLPGTGQLYNKQTSKGAVIIAIMLTCTFGWWMLIVLSSLTRSPVPLLFIPLMWITVPVTWVVQLIDAALIAGRLNRGEVVRPMQMF